MEKKRQYHLLAYGLGGHSAECSEGNGQRFRISGYDEPEVTMRRLESGDLSADELEGCLLLDKREVLTADPCLALSSPLPSCELAPGTVERFNQKQLDEGFAKDIAAEFCRTGHGHLIYSAAIGGLDQVATDVYVAWWKDRGARAGRIEAGCMIWDDPPIWTQYELIEEGGE